MAEKLKFALFGNVYQAKKSASVRQLISLLAARGAELYIESGFYNYLTKTLRFGCRPNGLITGRDFYADIAVSMGGDGVYILSAFSLLVVGFLLYWLKREQNLLVQISLGLVIGGAIGNVLDRVRIGAVFDFLDFHLGDSHWPAFNAADSFICIGAMMIIVHGLWFNEQSAEEKA